MEYAFKVNDVAIKNYDIKKDEHFIIDWDVRDDDNTEPYVSKMDPHLNDRITTKIKVKPVIDINSEISKSSLRRAESRNKMNKSPMRRSSTRGS